MNSKISIIILTAIVIASCFLSACSFIQPSGATVAINVKSAQYLNPDLQGVAVPVVLTIYQLKNPYTFKQSTYTALEANSNQVLGTALLDKDMVEVRPHSQLHLSEPIALDTKFIGITAGYRNIDNAVWRQVIPIDPVKHKTSKISVNLQSQELIATAVK